MDDLIFITIPQGVNIHPTRKTLEFVPQFQMADSAVTRLLFWEACQLPQINTEIDIWQVLEIKNPLDTPEDLDLPVSNMTEVEAIECCRRLSKETGLEITLPTCDQWEWACNQGELTDYWFGNEFDHKYGRFYKSIPSSVPLTHSPVRSFIPNKLGLYDMHGNVWELARSSDVPNYWVEKKGGSSYSPPRRGKTYNRAQCYYDERVSSTGFRVCVNQPEPIQIRRQDTLKWLVS